MREITYRIEVLRQGATLMQLCWERADAPNLYFNAEAAIHGSLSGTFFYDTTVDMLNDELRPIMTLNGRDFPLGIYRAASSKQVGTATGKRLQLTAYDRCWQVQCCRTAGVLHFNAGIKYLDAIQQLLLEAGISQVLSTPTDAVLQTSREDWPIGTDYLSICNTLLSEINFQSLWFDTNGFARLSAAEDPHPDRVAHHYSPADLADALPVSSDFQMQTDLFDKPNVFVVVCSNPDLSGPMVATSINDSPVSAASTTRRGIYITQITKVDNIASQAALQSYADRLRSESLLGDVTVYISTLAESDHRLQETIALSLPDLAGLYQELDWSLTMRSGELMHHTLRKVVAV